MIGVGAQVGVLLPFSRRHESEADEIGQSLMAQAGFDPAESVALWRNMARAGGGGGPEFLSTHPSHDTRIRDLQSGVARAAVQYREAQAAGRRPDCVPPRL
jgi:predicted Zn-dependent protease